MLEHTAAPPHRRKRRSKAPAIVARAVVFAAVALEIDAREVGPELARRMRDHGGCARVEPGVTGFIPTRVGAEQTRIGPERIDEECSYTTHWVLTG